MLSLVTNVFLLLPGLPLLVILAAFLPPGLGTVILVLTVTGWAGAARVLRSQALVHPRQGLRGSGHRHRREAAADHVPGDPAQHGLRS